MKNRKRRSKLANRLQRSMYAYGGLREDMQDDYNYTGNTAKGIGTGALQGAASGAAFGPVGAVVGGAIGAIGGAFTAGAENAAARSAYNNAKKRQMERDQEIRNNLLGTFPSQGIEGASFNFKYGGKTNNMAKRNGDPPKKLGQYDVRYHKRDNRFLERQFNKARRRDIRESKRLGLDPYNQMIITRQNAMGRNFIRPGAQTLYSQPVYDSYLYDSNRQSDRTSYNEVPFFTTGLGQKKGIYSQEYDSRNIPNFIVGDGTVDFSRLSKMDKRNARRATRQGPIVKAGAPSDLGWRNRDAYGNPKDGDFDSDYLYGDPNFSTGANYDSRLDYVKYRDKDGNRKYVDQKYYAEDNIKRLSGFHKGVAIPWKNDGKMRRFLDGTQKQYVNNKLLPKNAPTPKTVDDRTEYEAWLKDRGIKAYGGLVKPKYQMGGMMPQQGQMPMQQQGGMEPIASDVQEVQGPPHELGGVQMGPDAEVEGGEVTMAESDGSTAIFSDRLEYEKGVTFADKADELGRKKGKQEEKLDSTSMFVKGNAKRQIEKIDAELDMLFNEQEVMKRQMGIPSPEEQAAMEQQAAMQQQGMQQQGPPMGMEQGMGQGMPMEQGMPMGMEQGGMPVEGMGQQMPQMPVGQMGMYGGKMMGMYGGRMKHMYGGRKFMMGGKKKSMMGGKKYYHGGIIHGPNDPSSADWGELNPYQKYFGNSNNEGFDADYAKLGAAEPPPIDGGEMYDKTLKAFNFSSDGSSSAKPQAKKGMGIKGKQAFGAGVSMLGDIANIAISAGTPQASLPNTLQAMPLKTDVDISAQKAAQEAMQSNTAQAIKRNTASSQTARANLIGSKAGMVGQSNTMYEKARNMRNQLINQDRLNQQQTTFANVGKEDEYDNQRLQRAGTVKGEASAITANIGQKAGLALAESNQIDADMYEMEILKKQFQANGVWNRNLQKDYEDYLSGKLTSKQLAQRMASANIS